MLCYSFKHIFPYFFLFKLKLETLNYRLHYFPQYSEINIPYITHTSTY